MLIEEIKNNSVKGKVLLLFDMDGTCVEYGAGEKQEILDNVEGFYLRKRPLKSTIKEMKKLSNLSNIEVGILSNCYYKEQKQDKLAWIDKYLPFLNKDNIFILVYTELTFNKEDKNKLKVNFIENNLVNKYQKVYLIEDQHDIIKATNKRYDNMAHHVSEILP